MKTIAIINALLCGFAVAWGAFGAHGLSERLEQVGKQAIWNTAEFYLWVHLLSIWIVIVMNQIGLIAPSSSTLIAIIWMTSIFIFCGTLYAIALGAPSFLGAITPIGGLGYIIGWLLLAWALLKNPQIA